ncbi:MAG: cation:proton antiporter [Gammaproteobacteria bacterium]|nr:cation:proton antiporter [Gammaproteobacteria bacterium]
MQALSHLAIVWCSVYVAVFLAARTRLTPVLYFLAIGSTLVNAGVLPHESNVFIAGLADLGIVLIMFALGFEENSSRFVSAVKRSWGIALFGAVVPFAVAYAVTQYFWGDYHMSLMCGLAMTATAVSLTMVSLKSSGLQQSAAATGIMSSAVLDDIGSLILVAVLIPIASGVGEVSAHGLLVIAAKVVVFFAIVVFMGVVLFPEKRDSAWSRIPVIRYVALRSLLAFDHGEHATLGVLVVALLTGLLAHLFGFHPAIGAYMAGLVLKEEYFRFGDELTVNYYERTRQIVDNVAFSWIGPVFFVNLGAHIVFDWSVLVGVAPQVVVLFVGLFVGQVASAALAARYTGGFDARDSLLIGFGMLGRAELAFVVIDIAYVQLPILNTETFYMLMATAFGLNVAVPVTIAWWKRRYPEAALPAYRGI